MALAPAPPLLLLAALLLASHASANSTQPQRSCLAHASVVQGGGGGGSAKQPRSAFTTDYQSCPYIQKGVVMPHYRCERKETRLLAGKYDLAFPPGRASACGAKLPPVRDAVRRLAELLAHGRRRLCLSGDSLLNQMYHGIECMLHGAGLVSARRLSQKMSARYKIKVPWAIEVDVKGGGSIRYAKSFPCGDGVKQVFDECGKADVVALNAAYLHCSHITGTLNRDMGDGARVNAAKTKGAVRDMLRQVRKRYSDVILVGQPAVELVNIRNGPDYRKTHDRHHRHKGDVHARTLSRLEAEVARDAGVSYVPSYALTRHPLDERLREAWKRQYSIGRTDKVHYCLAGGVVDFAAYGVVVRAGEALNGTSTEGDDEPWWWEERGDASSKRKPASGRKRWRRGRRGRSSL